MTTQASSASPLDITVRAQFEEWVTDSGVWPGSIDKQNDEYRFSQVAEAWRIWRAAAKAERERICAAIKTEDDHCSTGDYMLDSDDCIAVARGEWTRPDYGTTEGETK